MSPTEACHAGLFSAVPQPIRKVKPSSVQGVSAPNQAASVSATETASMKTWATSMTRRRLKLSAIAPAASEKTMIGSVVEACTSATMLAEVVIEVIIQAAPTACTRPPKFDARLASQIARNVGLLQRRQGRGRRRGGLRHRAFSTLSRDLAETGPRHNRCRMLAAPGRA